LNIIQKKDEYFRKRKNLFKNRRTSKVSKIYVKKNGLFCVFVEEAGDMTER